MGSWNNPPRPAARSLPPDARWPATGTESGIVLPERLQRYARVSRLPCAPGLQHIRDAPALLVVAAEQEEDLGLEGIARPVFVEVGQERILLKNLQLQFGVKIGLQQARKRGFSDADDALNGNIHGDLKQFDTSGLSDGLPVRLA